MGLALICAGQGGQHIDMFERLGDEVAAQPVLDLVSVRAGVKVRALRQTTSDTELAQNRLAQILVVGHALAGHAALAREGIRPLVCAGYSVGEMAAHACGGVWTPAVALALTDARASCMDAASRTAETPLRMVAVVGLDAIAAQRLADEHGCEIAIINGPAHFVFGGPMDAVAALEHAALTAGASHVRHLPVSLASHTRFIRSAGPRFAESLAAAPWSAPDAIVLSGLDGRAIASHDDTVALLSRQIHEPLRWSDCLQSVFEHGATVVLEIGPGRAIAKMVEEAYPEVPVRAYDEFRSAAGAATWIRRHL